MMSYLPISDELLFVTSALSREATSGTAGNPTGLVYRDGDVRVTVATGRLLEELDDGQGQSRQHG
jgi:hypothetical protein